MFVLSIFVLVVGGATVSVVSAQYYRAQLLNTANQLFSPNPAIPGARRLEEGSAPQLLKKPKPSPLIETVMVYIDAPAGSSGPGNSVFVNRVNITDRWDRPLGSCKLARFRYGTGVCTFNRSRTGCVCRLEKLRPHTFWAVAAPGQRFVGWRDDFSMCGYDTKCHRQRVVESRVSVSFEPTS